MGVREPFRRLAHTGPPQPGHGREAAQLAHAALRQSRRQDLPHGGDGLWRSDHAFGAFYRRLAARIGKAKAITATARKLAVLAYRMLRYHMPYREMPTADYDKLQRSRILRGLRKRAASLGFELVDTSTGLVM